MEYNLLEPYRDVQHHQIISGIIRDFSSNDRTPGEVLLDGLDLHNARAVLDLGCGFGYMTESLARRVARNACITGIDACETNDLSFTGAVSRTGRCSRFICDAIDRTLPFDNCSFDVVLSSYSLYFFVEAIADIARVLREDGCFIAISHNMELIDALIDITGLSHSRAVLTNIFGSFCGENAVSLLAPHFSHVEEVTYRNRLCFRKENIRALMTYVEHKLPFLLPGTFHSQGVEHDVLEAVPAYFEAHGEVVIQKDDCCFRCTGPRRRAPR